MRAPQIEKIYYKHYRYPKREGVIIPSVSTNKTRPYIQRYGFTNKDQKYPYSRRKTKWEPACKGGKTLCFILLSNGGTIIGHANCSRKDNFCYRIGREISYGRAMKLYKKYLCDKSDYSEIIISMSA